MRERERGGEKERERKRWADGYGLRGYPRAAAPPPPQFYFIRGAGEETVYY